MLFIPTTRLRGRRMCIVFVTCLTEGAREALSTPKHPKLTKVKKQKRFFRDFFFRALDSSRDRERHATPRP